MNKPHGEKHGQNTSTPGLYGDWWGADAVKLPSIDAAEVASPSIVVVIQVQHSLRAVASMFDAIRRYLNHIIYMSVMYSFSKMFDHLRKRDRSSQVDHCKSRQSSPDVARGSSPQAGVAFPHDAVRLVDKCVVSLVCEGLCAGFVPMR
ncbi:MAG TPA: hypothetical protein VN229_21035 [Terriglobales bacterium]|nr:hypothetical protein [Terriglobales bacterium]